LNLESVGYDLNHADTFLRNLEERLKEIPGVEAAGGADVPLLSGGHWVAPMIVIAGYPPKPGQDMTAHVNAVSPGYFKTLGIHLLAGRVFRESDARESLPVAVVNESFVKRFFGNRPPIGHFVGKGNDPSTPADTEIIGIVNDTDYENLREAAPRQFASIRRLLRELDPQVPISSHEDSGATSGRLTGDRAHDRFARFRVQLDCNCSCSHWALRGDGVHGYAAGARDGDSSRTGGNGRARHLAGDARSRFVGGNRHCPCVAPYFGSEPSRA